DRSEWCGDHGRRAARHSGRAPQLPLRDLQRADDPVRAWRLQCRLGSRRRARLDVLDAASAGRRHRCRGDLPQPRRSPRRIPQVRLPVWSHRHLDQVGPLTSIPFTRVCLAAALLSPLGGSTRQSEDPLAARSKGARAAPVTVYEMADFQCPACRMCRVAVLPTRERELVATGKVRWVFINLPLTNLHPNAVAAAEVAMCAARQGRFWQTHDALYAEQDTWAKLPDPGPTLSAIA